jgi:hypothetical protein
MDERLEKALSFAEYRVTLFQQLEALKLKTQNGLKYSINGGTFKIDRELISFAKVLLDDRQTGAFLLDVNELPIFIDDLPAFYEEIYSIYFEVMNDYGEGYERIRKSRKVAAIVETREEGNG